MLRDLHGLPHFLCIIVPTLSVQCPTSIFQLLGQNGGTPTSARYNQSPRQPVEAADELLHKSGTAKVPKHISVLPSSNLDMPGFEGSGRAVRGGGGGGGIQVSGPQTIARTLYLRRRYYPWLLGRRRS